MKFEQAIPFLKTCIQARLPVLLTGAPGVGKSDLISSCAAAVGADMIVSHPVVSESTDAKGLPFPDKKGESAKFLPYGELAQALKATKPTVWFVDDLGQASMDVQASFMQLFLARRIGEHVLPDCVTFLAATNRKQDRAGVQGLLEPVKSRFSTIIELEPDADSWISWALSNGMPPLLVALLSFRKDLLWQPSPTLDLVNSPSPRTWTNLGKLINAGVDNSILFEVAKGSVGEGAAMEFAEFSKVWRELPSPEAVLLAPDDIALPENVGTIYALTSALAHLSTKGNFSRIYRYALRMNEAGQGEFAAFLIRSCVLRNKELASTATYIEALSGEMSALFV